VAPGTLWRDLLAAAGPADLTGLVGTTPGLSVVGYSLHGGLGVLCRRFGFAANQIRAAEVVLGSGEVVRADRNDHPDLFWALRGGGGGFGVVTEVEIELQRAPRLYGGQLIWAGEQARPVLNAWSEWVRRVPPELTSMAAVMNLPPLPDVPSALQGRTVVAVTLCHLGAAAEGEPLVAPLRRVAPLLADNLRPLRVGELDRLRFEPSAPSPIRMRADLLLDLQPATVDALVAAADPVNGSPLGLVEVRHLGGALALADDGHGAVDHVDAPFLVEALGFAATPHLDASIASHQQRLATALDPWRTTLGIPSFADPERDGGRVFDTNTMLRLQEVKRRYDPGAVLRPSFSFLERERRASR
jgi:hypothetical protein